MYLAHNQNDQDAELYPYSVQCVDPIQIVNDDKIVVKLEAAITRVCF